MIFSTYIDYVLYQDMATIKHLSPNILSKNTSTKEKQTAVSCMGDSVEVYRYIHAY